MIKKTLVLRITLLITAAVLILFGFLMGVQLFTSESDVFTVVCIAVGVIWFDMILGLFIVYALNKLLTLIDRNENFLIKRSLL